LLSRLHRRPHFETHPALTQAVICYLDLKSVQALALASTTMREIVDLMAAPLQVNAHKPSSPLDATPGTSCHATFKTWGRLFAGLSLHRTPMADAQTLPALLGLTKHLRRLTVHDCDAAHWSDDGMGHALVGLPRLQELRLHCSDLAAYDHSPYCEMVKALGPPVGALAELRKLTLFTRLDAEGTASLAAFLLTPQLSRRLVKLKLSTSLVSSPGGIDVLQVRASGVGASARERSGRAWERASGKWRGRGRARAQLRTRMRARAQSFAT
jgi:hypothetical protein